MKNKNFKHTTKKIIKKKTHCYFISPHLDDAALSAGGLISFLAGKTPVTVVNVFTKAHRGTPTFSVRSYLKQCGYKDADSLFAQRRKEDKKLFKKLGVKVINLGYTDAMWRRKENGNFLVKLMGKIIPELTHVYPTYQFHSFTGRISSRDKKLLHNLSTDLKEIINIKSNYQVFCPVGIGNYIDHVIVRDVCTQIFSKIFYWSDFNYSMEFSGKNKFINKNNLNISFFNESVNSKKKLIEGYKSQIYAIFPHGKIPALPDFFYIN